MGKRPLKIYIFSICYLLILSVIVSAGSVPEYNINYSGEVKLKLESEDGENIFNHDYYLYLQGNPSPGLNLLTFIKPGGDKLDQFFLSYQKEGLEIQMGDFSLSEMKNNFFNFENDQRGLKTIFHEPKDGYKFEMFGALIKGIHQKDEIEGVGSTGPYYLNYGPVIPESEEIKINGVKLSNDGYQIDYELARIILEESLEDDEKMVVYYSYQPGGGFYERVIRGASTTIEQNSFIVKGQMIEMKDNPKEGKSLFLPAKKYTAGGLIGEWQCTDWLRTENQLVWSKLSGFQEMEGMAYDGLIKLGNISHLQFNYIYQEPDFLTSINQIEKDPLEEYQLQGRWLILPMLNLSFYYNYQNDNPKDDLELITKYIKNYSLRTRLDLDSRSYLQIGYLKNELSDDLVLLPEGKESENIFINYYQDKPLEFGAGIETGKIIWIGNSSDGLGLDHRYLKTSTSFDLEKKKFSSGLNLESRYLEPLEADSWALKLEHDIAYNMGYQFNESRIFYSGEGELEDEYQRLAQNISLRKNFLKFYKGQLKYQWEQEKYPEELDEFDQKIIGQLYYFGSATIEATVSYTPDKKMAKVSWKKSRLKYQIDWLKGEELEKTTGQLNYNEEPFKITLQLQSRKEDQLKRIWLFAIDGSYKLREGVKLKFSGELPLGQNKEVIAKSTTELIFSF